MITNRQIIKLSVRALWGVFIFIITLFSALVLLFKITNKSNGQIISSGKMRKFLLHVPKIYDPSTPTSLVISLHGFAEWPAHQMEISGWNDLADRHGFIVVYPCGTGFPLRWRVWGETGSAHDPDLDVAFISDLIDVLIKEYNIDPARIFVNGLSNGGGMSFLLSCRLAERIAAIGTVAGAILVPWDDCNPSRSVPLIAFHGTGDPIVPYLGGPSRSFELPFPAVPDWIAEYARRAGCNSDPVLLPTIGEVSGIKYSNSEQKVDVFFYTVEGGGHSWPGGGSMPKFIVGHTTRDIDATQTMWEFFQKHPKLTPGGNRPIVRQMSN